MRFLITRDFFKNISREKIEQVKNRIEYFYREISENKKMIFEAPKGFWVKKLRENLYEFRVNSGDRVLFEFRKINREGYVKKELILLLLSFDKHDIVIVKGDRKDRNFLKIESLVIEKDVKKLDEYERTQSEIDTIYNKINSKIIYEITSDENLLELIKNEDEYTYYYLNDEQYEILNDQFPIFLKGSAGSGKTTVAIRKAMELETYQEYKIGYITFTQPLKEKAYEMYEKFRDPICKRMVEFYSLEELYEKQLKERPVGVKIFEKFIYEYNPSMPKNVESLELYQEIRGIIKGGMGANGIGNWDRDLTNELIPKKDYLVLNKKHTVYTEEIRENIYKIAIDYQIWLGDRKLLDENDLARGIILEGQEIFDCIICDEVQDLTEVEIYMLKKLVKNGENLFLAGDVHQIINPTYFNFSRVKSLFYKGSYTEKTLSKNYRSQKKIVDLANKLSDLRARYIGKLGEDYKEVSILEGQDIFISENNISFLKELEENTTIILVPTSQTKESLRAKIPKIANKILTVQDIKGLEFDSVVLYNFATELKKYWRIIFKGEAKTNQLYRYYFNLLYVGLTRARKRLLLMEADKNNCLIEELKGYLLPLTVEGKRDFTLRSGELDFLKEGKEFLSQRLFFEAIAAFEKSGAKKYLKKAKDELKADNFFNEYGEEKTIKYIVEKDDSLSYCLEKYVVGDKIGNYAFEKRNYIKAKKYYEKSGNFEKLSELFEVEGDLEKSIECARRSSNNLLIERLGKEIEKNNKALELANEVRVLSDKKIWLKEYSLVEFENLDKRYMMKKQTKNIEDIFIILNGRFKTKVKSSKKQSIKSPTKLLIKLYHIEGGKNGIDYLLENYANQLNIETIVSLLDSGNILEKYISKSKKKIDLNKLLLIACDNRRINNTKKLLKLGGNIEIKSNDNNTLLMSAIRNSDLEMVKLLIRNGVKLGDENGEKTPLILAIEYNNDEIFEYLLRAGADVDLTFPLFWAVLEENMYAVKRLIEVGSKLDVENIEKRPIMVALSNQNLKLLKLLIDGGANLEKGKNIISPMEIIIGKNNVEGLKLFLEKGYELSERELNKLSRKNSFELSKLVLIEKLGYNYKEQIENKIIFIKRNKNRGYPMNIKGNIEKIYDFEKYRG